MSKRRFSSISRDKGVDTSALNPSMDAINATVTDSSIIPDYRQGKNHLRIIPKKGETMDVCATIHPTYRCCNVHVLKSVSNCPFDCSYCFLQNYLNDGQTKVVGDIAAMMDEVKQKLAAEPNRLFRIGTWELGDSLALERDTGQAWDLIHEFAMLDNAILELKTKSDVVDPILTADHNGRTVVSWSLNPDELIRLQEHRTARLSERLDAIKKVRDAGYVIGLHFDPMIWYDGWENAYPDLVRQLAAIVPKDQIAWISFGSLRFNPEMKYKMEANFPKSTITLPEMVLGDDGKLRYVKPQRVAMYQTIYSAIRQYWGDNLLVYLCMERYDMWEKIMGYSPESIEDLDFRFASSLYQRFPQFRHVDPLPEYYR